MIAKAGKSSWRELRWILFCCLCLFYGALNCLDIFWIHVYSIKCVKKVNFWCTRRGARDGAVVWALPSHQRGPGSNPGVDAICWLSLLSALSFAFKCFSPGTPGFSSPQKLTFPNSNSTRIQVDEEPLCEFATSKSLFIYLFIYWKELFFRLAKKFGRQVECSYSKSLSPATGR